MDWQVKGGEDLDWGVVWRGEARDVADVMERKGGGGGKQNRTEKISAWDHDGRERIRYIGTHVSSNQHS